MITDVRRVGYVRCPPEIASPEPLSAWPHPAPGGADLGLSHRAGMPRRVAHRRDLGQGDPGGCVPPGRRLRHAERDRGADLDAPGHD